MIFILFFSVHRDDSDKHRFQDSTVCCPKAGVCVVEGCGAEEKRSRVSVGQPLSWQVSEMLGPSPRHTPPPCATLLESVFSGSSHFVVKQHAMSERLGPRGQRSRPSIKPFIFFRSWV